MRLSPERSTFCASPARRCSQKSSASGRADPPDDRVHHPGARLAARRAGVLEERDVRAGAAALVGVEEVVDGRIVLVDGLLHQPQTQHPGVEVDVPGRVAGDQRDVVDPFELHRCIVQARVDSCGMKVGIVVPFSWSFWGAVVEHAELQAAALRELGHDVRLIMGNDPPGQFTRVLHPRVGRHGEPPPEVIPIGRSVIVPANGSLPNIILSPRSVLRIKRVLARESFDLLHLHEPMTPTPCIAALALFDGPMVGTHHASGDLGWMRLAKPVWGFLEERLDRRIAVSEQARASAQRWLPGEYEIVPNGVLVPEAVEPGGREHRIVFAGRQEPRKGLQVLLRAWPEIRRRTGAGCGSPAPTRSRCGCCWRACASPTTGSTCSASSPRRI